MTWIIYTKMLLWVTILGLTGFTKRNGKPAPLVGFAVAIPFILAVLNI